ncbi:LURP-one-related 17-like protein [Drosera capensis]
MEIMSSIRRSRAAVHPQPKFKNNSVMDDVMPCTSLTVWRKSLVCCCDGFTVIGSEGELVYRVDNYRGHSGEIVLMDNYGRSIHTIRRHKKLSQLVDYWLVYDGEASDGPMFSVKKQGNILNSNSNVLAHVFLRASMDKRPTYSVEGSYSQRSCKVLDQSRNVMVEIKSKEAANIGASFGSEVFQLVVRPGFDTGLAMTVVLLLDQMFS